MRLKEQNKGISIANIRAWALVCATVGIAAITVIIRGILGIDLRAFLDGFLYGDAAAQTAVMTQAKELLQGEQTRNYVVVALICLAVETCAVPMFCLMLVEGSYRTLDLGKYIIRTALVAVVSEVPYDYATTGQLLDLSNLNPAFGTTIALIMLYFFLRYSDSTAGHYLLRSVITAAAILWAMMFNIYQGQCIVLIAAVLWTFWNKPLWRSIMGSVACLVCAIAFPILSPLSLPYFLYIVAPLSMILLYFYRGEKGSDFKWGRLIAYPAILLLAALVHRFIR